MGPGRSSSLRIGDDSPVVAGSGRARDASSRPTVVEPQNVVGAPLLPLDKGKEIINLITYPGGGGGGGGGGHITLNLPSNTL